MGSVRPSASLTHPLFLVALATLALNDHVLKATGAWPALSGKLSDFAGLLVAPLVLAWLCRASSRRAFLACHVAVGAGFAALQVPAIAEALERALPVHLWPDATDLIALPALAVSFLVLGRPRAHRPAPAIGAVALLLCAASNLPGSNEPPPRYPFPPAGVLETDVFIRNHLAADVPITVWRVRDEVTMDCDRVLLAPDEELATDDFGDEQRWTIASRDAVPLWDRRGGAMTRDCYAVRLKARDVEWIISWRDGTPPLREIPIRLEPHQSPEAGAMRISEEPRTPPYVPANVTVRRWEH
ncbi:MAG: hypothetical protein H6719_15905 [Sandaracinaceae bacterium]|nr:hypothetical protein [Sandaracinaceae bacterium]